MLVGSKGGGDLDAEGVVTDLVEVVIRDILPEIVILGPSW